MVISFDTAKRRKARRGAGELISVSLIQKNFSAGKSGVFDGAAAAA